jgi:proline iminopeptidase
MIAPLDGAVALARAWREARFFLVEGESHSTGDPGIRRALLEATDRFAELA